MLLSELADVLAVKRALSREQFLVNDREAVLITGFADLTTEGFRRGVQRRDAAEQPGGRLSLQMFHQAEVGYFYPVAKEEKVARLDIEVLQVMLLVHVVERFRGVSNVAQQRIAGNADQAGVLTLNKRIVKTFVGQLHDNDKLAVD